MMGAEEELVSLRAELRDAREQLAIVRRERDRESWWRDQLREAWHNAERRLTKARNDYDHLLGELLKSR